MGRMECCKMDVSHVANHSRPTSCLGHIIFIFFFHIIFDLLTVTDRVPQLFQLVFVIFSLFFE